MSSSSTTPAISNDGPRRRRKGQTCLNCRRRKIRCDGVRPVCGLCTSGNASFEDCEYPGDGPTETQLLEERIFQVQDRIRNLMNPDEHSGLSLHNPYVADGKTRTSSPESSHGSDESHSGSSHGSQQIAFEPFHEPPVNRRLQILDPFAKFADQVGFFLNWGRFSQTMLLPSAFEDFSRPSPALISVVYLWARHLSASGPSEQTLLSNVLHFLAHDLTGAHPYRVPHSIQAEVLLSYYYLKNGKMLEGNHHADAALSLSIANNLHRIRSPTMLRSPGQMLPPPMDPIEEGEHIDAFWVVFILTNHWATIQGSHSTNFAIDGNTVETPWPMDDVQREFAALPTGGQKPIQRFLDGRSVEGYSEKALLAKASVLFERANSSHYSNRHTLIQSGVSSHLESLIDTMQSNLPLPDAPYSSIRTRDRRTVTQMLVYAAMLELHRPFCGESDLSYRKCMFAARSIARLTQYLPSRPGERHINPIVGAIGSLACQTMMPYVSHSSDELSTSVETIVSFMRKFSEYNPLFRFMLMRIVTQ